MPDKNGDVYLIEKIMQVKLDKISEWTTTGFKLNNGAYQYAPINAKNHFARGKDEFVIWGSGDDDTSYGIVWIKAGRWSFIPSPAQKKSWKDLRKNVA